MNASTPTISKTDYILWKECPKNAWIRVHRPDIYGSAELTEFDQSIIDNGIEVEEVARSLFPDGILIEGRDAPAQEKTQQLIAAKTSVLFQPIFEKDGFLAAVDVIRYADSTGGYFVYEIKASTKPKDEHLYDLAFQVLLLRRCGLKIDRAFITHLNPEYVRSGALDIKKLFIHTDMTAGVDEIAEAVGREMEEARAYLLNETEPDGSCPCIYRGRSRHCSTFAYSNPQVPEYGVHDITRIGNSPKKLKEMVDAGVFALDKVPTHIELSAIQQEQIRAYVSGETVVQKNEIAAELGTLTFPLYFIDYETYSPPIPLFDGYAPYDDIPFQYSLHIVNAPGEEPVHKEFLKTDMEDPSSPLAITLQENIGPRGSIIVWNKTFESNINKAIAARSPEFEPFMTDLNSRIYDLKDIFSKQYYVHKNLWGKVSIKKVLPVLAPDFSYASLDIHEGGTASVAWNNIASGKLSKKESDELREALKKYCGMDSYAMYAIWQALNDMVSA